MFGLKSYVGRFKRLFLGGTEVTATAAELNLLDTSVAGTAVASKALVLGADKNVDTLAIADGGLKLGVGAGTAVTATAAELNRGALKKATGDLAAVDTGGGVFAWQNPETSDILIELVRLVSTHVTTGACAVDVGTTATDATTASDNLIDGVDLNAATGTFTNIESAGTNGKFAQTLATGKWVTGSVESGGASASAGLVGTYEIYYRVL